MGLLRARIFGFVAISAALGGAAHAGTVTMPFDCRFDGARVHLRPSEDRTYAILGASEREMFTTCSPVDPGRCSSWFVYRFDFDCGGDRVAWMDAAEAAARFADWDAWVADGRFQMRMSRDWGVAHQRPIFAGRPWMRRRYRDRDAAERGFEDPYDNPRVVATPPGFAPAVGIPLTFGGPEPGTPAAAEAPIARAPAVAAYTAAPSPPRIPDLPQRAPRRPAPAAQTELTAAAPEPAPAPTPAPKVAGPAEMPAPTVTDPVVAAAPAPKPAPVARGEEAPGAKTAEKAVDARPSGPGNVTIINAPAANRPEAPAQTAPQAPSPSPVETAPVETATVVTKTSPDDRTPAHAQTAGPAEPAANDAAGAPTPPPQSPELAPASQDKTTLYLAATGAGAAVLAGLVGVWLWRRRRSGAVRAPSAGRDLASISFGPAPGAPAAVAVADAGAAPAPEGSIDATALSGHLPIPTTYAQALTILGASPDATIGAIKKIVDGLRQSWHPDRATSEEDRRHRERRLQQINVAWDLVSQKRTAA